MIHWLKRFYFLVIGLFLALPLIVVAGVSVNAKQTLAFPPQGFSLSWYGEILPIPNGGRLSSRRWFWQRPPPHWQF